MKIKLFGLLTVLLLGLGSGASAATYWVSDGYAVELEANKAGKTIEAIAVSGDEKKIAYLALEKYKYAPDRYFISLFDVESKTETLLATQAVSSIFENPVTAGTIFWQDKWDNLVINFDGSYVGWSAHPYKNVIDSVDQSGAVVYWHNNASIWKANTFSVVRVSDLQVKKLAIPNSANAVGARVSFLNGDISKALLIEYTVPKKDIGQMYTTGFKSAAYTFNMTWDKKMTFKSASSYYASAHAISDDGKSVASCVTKKGKQYVQVRTLKTNKVWTSGAIPSGGAACYVSQVFNDGRSFIVRGDYSNTVYLKDNGDYEYGFGTRVKFVGTHGYYFADGFYRNGWIEQGYSVKSIALDKFVAAN